MLCRAVRWWARFRVPCHVLGAVDLHRVLWDLQTPGCDAVVHPHWDNGRQSLNSHSDTGGLQKVRPSKELQRSQQTAKPHQIKHISEMPHLEPRHLITHSSRLGTSPADLLFIWSSLNMGYTWLRPAPPQRISEFLGFIKSPHCVAQWADCWGLAEPVRWSLGAHRRGLWEMRDKVMSEFLRAEARVLSETGSAHSCFREPGMLTLNVLLRRIKKNT